MRTWLIIGILSLATVLFGQGLGFDFQRIGSTQGLPSDNVQHLIKDRQGYLWLTTGKGLCRYDGYRFLVSDLKWSLSEGLALDDKGNIICAMGAESLLRMNPITIRLDTLLMANLSNGEVSDDHFYNPAFNLKERSIWTVTQDFVRRTRLDSGVSTTYNFDLKIDVGHRTSFQAYGNAFYMATMSGLFTYAENGQWELVKDFKGKNLYASCIVDGAVWTASTDGKIWKYQVESKKSTSYTVGIEGVNSIAYGVDPYGQAAIWIGHAKGLSLYYPQSGALRQELTFQEEGIEVRQILIDDATKSVWLATNNGLYQWTEMSSMVQAVLLPATVSKPSQVNAIVADSNPDLFLLGLSQGGVLRWNKSQKTFEHFALPIAASVNNITIIAGAIWASTNRGLFVLKRGKKHFEIAPMLIPYQNVNRVYADRKGRIWVTPKYEPGFLLFKQQTFEPIKLPEHQKTPRLSPHQLEIFDIAEDNAGTLWLGTEHCLYWMQSDSFFSVSGENYPLNSDYLLSLTPDKVGIWASGGGGSNYVSAPLQRPCLKVEIAEFENKQYQNLVVENDSIVWILTPDGVLRISLARTKEYAATGYTLFSENDGLHSNHDSKAMLMTNDGLILVGQKNGFATIKSGNFNTLDRLEPPKISHAIIEEDKSTRWNPTTLHLSIRQRGFEVFFSSLQFKPLSTKYRYRLIPLETEWHETTGQHASAVYHSIAPGNYTIEVCVADNREKWSKAATLAVYITPKWQETTFAKWLFITLGVGFIYFLYRFRMFQISRVQRMRNQISIDLHDDIGATLSNVNILTTLVRRKLSDEHEAQVHLNRIEEEMQAAGESLDDIIWSVNPKNDTIADITARMRRFSNELFDAKDIISVINIAGDVEKTRIGMYRRRDIWLCFKEAVNNLAKYAKCTHAYIDIELVNKKLCILVKDNGVGFDPLLVRRGNGLSNMEKRVKKRGGSIEIDSKIGEGTCIKIIIPVGLW